MKRNRSLIPNRIVHLIVVSVMWAIFVSPLASWGQNVSPGAASHEMTRPNTDNQAFLDQITELRAEVAKLRAVLQQTDPMKTSSAGSGMKVGGGNAMGMMDDMGEMGGMSASQQRDMSSGSSRGMGMMGDQGEMGGMTGGKRRSGMGSMRGASSTMPGEPGASHLYHIGSTGFFLDHAKHIALTPEQQMTLNRLKEKALLDRTTQQRRIDQAEQELYMLTGADQPDAAQIQAKIAEIEKLRADQRMNFIRAVGEASNVLTHDQHRALLGTMTRSQK